MRPMQRASRRLNCSPVDLSVARPLNPSINFADDVSQSGERNGYRLAAGFINDDDSDEKGYADGAAFVVAAAAAGCESIGERK